LDVQVENITHPSGENGALPYEADSRRGNVLNPVSTNDGDTVATNAGASEVKASDVDATADIDNVDDLAGNVRVVRRDMTVHVAEILPEVDEIAEPLREQPEKVVSF
jgi:hypothetical protein